MHELYVDQRYSSFKEEIMHYRIQIPTIDAFTKIITKARYFIDTDEARSIKASVWYCTPQHYGIPNKSPLKCWNLISIILYTDFDALSSNFSGSFRKLHTFETLQSVKYRNSKYWWWSKTLRETIELYGISRRGNINEDDRNSGLCGPFFTGMSCVLDVPQFAISLNSPTSTSIHIEVAINFGGEDGMIIQLNNQKGTVPEDLTAFDCSWMSRYSGEDERYKCLLLFSYHE